MFNFSPETKHNAGATLIPARTLSFAVLTVKEMKTSQGTGGRYANCELTLAGGDFERRKVFVMMPDPSDSKNSEKWREMGMGHLQHCLEAAGILNPANPVTYQQAAAASFDDLIKSLDGHTVAIKVSVEKGQDTYPDRNGVSTFLSPNPASSTHGDWKKLAAGPQQAVPASPTGFGAPALAVPAAAGLGGTPAWLK